MPIWLDSTIPYVEKKGLFMCMTHPKIEDTSSSHIDARFFTIKTHAFIENIYQIVLNLRGSVSGKR